MVALHLHPRTPTQQTQGRCSANTGQQISEWTLLQLLSFCFPKTFCRVKLLGLLGGQLRANHVCFLGCMQYVLHSQGPPYIPVRQKPPMAFLSPELCLCPACPGIHSSQLRGFLASLDKQLPSLLCHGGRRLVRASRGSRLQLPLCPNSCDIGRRGPAVCI